MSSPHREDSDRLHQRVRALIADPRAASEVFDGLALEIARYQVSTIPAWARLVAQRGVDLARAATAAEIPAMVTDAFRFTRIAAHPPGEDAVVFRTSGTTQGDELRGAHPLRTTETYEASLLAWGRSMLLAGGPLGGGIALCPSSSEAPDSSLSFMVDRFLEAIGPARVGHFVHPARGLDVEGVARACDEARRHDAAALVMGTSFAFVQLLDAGASARLELPAGSRVMTTGGTKGRTREVDPRVLRRDLAARFGVPTSHVIGEYGMTELASQLYEPDLAAALGVVAKDVRTYDVPAYVAPPWLRVTAVDPEDLAPLPDGAIGLARFVDLANVDSAVAVQTADRVRVWGSTVELFGRLPGALPRGCSLALEHLLEGER